MIQTFKPKSILLQQYVDFFYIFNQDRSDNISYIAFPHVNTAISFFQGADIQRRNYKINIKATAKNKYCTEILGKYTQPVFVNYIGKCEEVAIVFKPFGVNHFFENDMIEIAPIYSQELKNTLWIEFSYNLFNTKNIIQRIDYLESFLLNNFREINNPKIYNALNYLDDFDANYSIEKIANLCGYTLKTFQRNFTKHLTCSPSEYKRISRFRHALQNKLISKEIKTLTSVSLESNYYDQSYFIREFKKLTQLNPKRFFNSITALDEKKIVWKVK